MSQLTKTTRRVRFEEVTPAHEYAAFFACSIESLVSPLGLPIFEGYDDLDELRLAFFTLKSGETVTLGEYLHSPQPGTSLYVDAAMQNIPQIVFDSCQQLQISRKEVLWFHADWQEAIDRLYAEHGEVEKEQSSLPVRELHPSYQYEPIDCFNHALQIYTRQEFPEYWAMLQHNLGLAYFDHNQNDSAKKTLNKRLEDLEQSINCFNNSLEIYTKDKFPEKWEINQQDLRKTQQIFELLRSKNNTSESQYFEIFVSWLRDDATEELREVVWDFMTFTTYLLVIATIEYFQKGGLPFIPSIILTTFEITLLTKIFSKTLKIFDDLIKKFLSLKVVKIIAKMFNNSGEKKESFVVNNNFMQFNWLKLKFKSEFKDLSGKFIIGALALGTIYLRMARI
jgi:tetratricopeptide (TPR) repeat protein